MKAKIVTLGCRLNGADSGLLAGRLMSEGYEIVDGGEVDLVVVNSCVVTNEAARKSRQVVRKLKLSNPGARVLVSGCGLKLGGWEKLADGVISTEGGKWVGGGVFEEKSLSEFPFQSRAFIKIQEGCNNFCSYCIVPYTRGRERSRAWEEVLEDCRHVLAGGYPEIVLTGVNTCTYADNGRNLGDLVREIAKIEGNFRIRLSSTEPHPANLSLLEVMSDPANRVCRFLHLSLQHGSDEILGKMNRKYSTAEYGLFVKRAREMVPGIHIGTDVIVGFPQETEENFRESAEFVREMEFANVHLFTYSKRPGTPAAEMDGQVDKEVAKERYNHLKMIAEKSAEEFRKSFVGKTLSVIFEEVKKDGMAHGWSDNYLAVSCDQSTPLERILPVKIIGIGADGVTLEGEVDEKS